VKIANDTNHIDAANSFTYFESDCMEETLDGEQVFMEAWILDDFEEDYNNHDNCLARCLTISNCLAVEWYASYQACYYYW
jgi:hypothetical protein